MSPGARLAAAALAFGLIAPARAETVPARPGQCVRTTIATIGTRLVDGGTGRPIADSGSVVGFANRVSLVSYETVEAIRRSRRGDAILLCLISIPQGCPPGDDRGRVYTATNFRTEQSWTLPDSQHRCGGA